MLKLTVACVILTLAVMSEGYVKSNRGHDDGNDERLRGNSQYPRPQEGLNGGQFQQGVHGGGSQYPRPQEGLNGGQFQQGVHGGGSQYPRPQEGLGGRNFQQGSQSGGSQYPRQQEGLGGGQYQGGGHNQFGNNQGGYKRHGY